MCKVHNAVLAKHKEEKVTSLYIEDVLCIASVIEDLIKNVITNVMSGRG